ncbi:MAG TPA: hypothetical protein VNB06_05205 [Thermoanaerobaculia bacterium]|nr:hypothetical protein [Thermoanaerobaculia bacterium]
MIGPWPKARAFLGIALATLAALPAAKAAAIEVPPTSCTLCHSSSDLFDDSAVAMVAGYADDVHASVGLSCHDCHGGNPDPALAEDLDAAMSEDFAPNPYLGTPSPREVPAACGRCHSDPETMRRFRPDLRVDQEAEYRTSHHGRALAAGDERVATCVSCHGVHDIKSSRDPASHTYPTKVAETCGGCHSSAETMAGSITRTGAELPIDQHTEWQVSVHAQALLEGGDLSAPTCNDCHGNHGATPPGVDSLAFVCGQCHVRESQLFLQSSKLTALTEHNELLAEEGIAGCADCHDASEPAAAITGVHEFLQCSACHDHHAVVRPTVAMLAPLPATPCAFCHEGPSPVEVEARTADAATYAARRDALLADGAELGLAGDELFDWLVDRALELDAHHAGSSKAGHSPGGASPLEFATLFRKLRIGKVHFELPVAADGAASSRSVVRCSTCHAEEPLLGSAEGLPFAAEYLDLMRTAAFETARAERLVLRARRGGVSVRAAQDEISRAIDAQIATQALIHSYSLAEDGELRQRFDAAIAHAASAAQLGEEALGELRTRRRGLGASLLLVLAALVALTIKIRQLG